MVARKATRNKMVRRSRTLMVSSKHWKARFVFWFGALALGLVSAAFAASSDYSQSVFETVTGHGHGPLRFLPLLITPLGFILCAWIADQFFPGSQGSGIPQVIAIRGFDAESDRTIYLSPRIVIGKVVMTVIALGCDASIGCEGPTVQIGAAMMLGAARIERLVYTRGLILAGSAAWIAAAFNTPLAGVVFVIEEMSRSYKARTNGVVLTTAIIAAIASLALMGNYTALTVKLEILVALRP